MVTMDGVNLDMESYGPDVKEIKGKKKKQANASCQKHSGDTRLISGNAAIPDIFNGCIDSEITKFSV